MNFNKRVFAVVNCISKGKVATYGQIAKLINQPNHSRQVGYALATLNSSSDVPWHRVVNAKGKISQRGFEGSDDYQRILLEAEDISFDENNCICLKQFLWQPNIDDISEFKAISI